MQLIQIPNALAQSTFVISSRSSIQHGEWWPVTKTWEQETASGKCVAEIVCNQLSSLIVAVI